MQHKVELYQQDIRMLNCAVMETSCPSSYIRRVASDEDLTVLITAPSFDQRLDDRCELLAPYLTRGLLYSLELGNASSRSNSCI